jgi:hypothetical protein
MESLKIPLHASPILRQHSNSGLEFLHGKSLYVVSMHFSNFLNIRESNFDSLVTYIYLQYYTNLTLLGNIKITFYLL